ncbi:MAG: DUF167 domain-containing protein [Candidatus Tectimicrobiota bacterium]
MDALRAMEGGVRLTVHVQPRAKATGWTKLHGDAFGVRVAAPPVKGKANQALIAFVAGHFGVAKSAVTIVRGERERRKVLAVAGVGLEEARARLSEPMELP